MLLKYQQYTRSRHLRSCSTTTTQLPRTDFWTSEKRISIVVKHHLLADYRIHRLNETGMGFSLYFTQRWSRTESPSYVFTDTLPISLTLLKFGITPPWKTYIQPYANGILLPTCDKCYLYQRLPIQLFPTCDQITFVKMSSQKQLRKSVNGKQMVLEMKYRY